MFETEQRQQYHGWDVEEHKRPDPAKISDNTEVSKEPMMTETMTAVSYPDTNTCFSHFSMYNIRSTVPSVMVINNLC